MAQPPLAGAARGQAVRIPSGSYQLLAARSQLAILLRKAGWLGAFADNHEIHASVMHGSASGEAGSWHGTVTAPTAQLQVVDPNRSAQQRHEIWATMEGPGQLDAQQFPDIVWRLDALEPTAAAPGFLLHGEFSIHGVTRTVTWPTHVAVENGVVHVWGSAHLLLTDYGIQPIRRALGAIQVKNQFELRWDTYWQSGTATSCWSRPPCGRAVAGHRFPAVAQPPLAGAALPSVGLWLGFAARQRTPALAHGVSELPRTDARTGLWRLRVAARS